MDHHKIAIKLFVESDTFSPTEFVPIFHHWIQNQSLDGHLLIDVADYAHVAEGPGTVLVAREANLQMDRGEKRLGVLYVRKQPIESAQSFEANLRGVFVEALKAAIQLEQSPELAGRLKFQTREISIRLNDRLGAPNTTETFARVRPAVEAVAKQLFPGEPVRIEQHAPDSPSLFEIRISGGKPVPIATVLQRADSAVLGVA